MLDVKKKKKNGKLVLNRMNVAQAHPAALPHNHVTAVKQGNRI